MTSRKKLILIPAAKERVGPPRPGPGPGSRGAVERAGAVGAGWGPVGGEAMGGSGHCAEAMGSEAMGGGGCWAARQWAVAAIGL